MRVSENCFMTVHRLPVITALATACLLAGCSSATEQPQPTEQVVSAEPSPSATSPELPATVVGVDVTVIDVEPLPEDVSIVASVLDQGSLWVLTETDHNVAVHRMNDGETWTSVELTDLGLPPGLGTPGAIVARDEFVTVVHGADLLAGTSQMPWIAYGTFPDMTVVSLDDSSLWNPVSSQGRDLSFSRVRSTDWVGERLVVTFEARWSEAFSTADYSIVALTLGVDGSISTSAVDAAPLGGADTQLVSGSAVINDTLHVVGTTSPFGTDDRLIEVWSTPDGLQWESERYRLPGLEQWLTVHGVASDGEVLIVQVEHSESIVQGERATIRIDGATAEIVDGAPGPASQIVWLGDQFLLGPTLDVIQDYLDIGVWSSPDGNTWTPLGEQANTLAYWQWTPYPDGVLSVGRDSIGYSGPWPFGTAQP